VRLPSLPGAVVEFSEASFRPFLDVEGTLQATVCSPPRRVIGAIASEQLGERLERIVR
jgi:hypothetical protein